MLRNRVQSTIAKPMLLTSLAVVLFAHTALFAAKGDSKDKKGYVLKFSGFDLKSTANSFYTLKPGFVYRGSFSNVEKAPQQTTLQSVITYQKGNTIFILPYTHKVILPKFKTPEPPKF